MEGDFPSGAMVLVKYHQIKNLLDGARNNTQSKPLIDRVGFMLDQLHIYLEEALECKVLVLATIMHPRCRLAFFQKAFPDQKVRATTLINGEFNLALETAQQESDLNQSQPPIDAQHDEDDNDDFNEFTASSNINPAQKAREGELESYLMGQREFKKNQTTLDWWKVSFKCSHF